MTARRHNKIKLTSFLLILIVVLGIIIYNTVHLALQTVYPLKYSELVEKYSAEYNLDEAFVYAVIETESGFNKDAVSEVGARGLMQIMPDTFKWLKSKTGEKLPDDALFEPEVSIRYGCFLLRYLLDEFENEKTALAAYHAGVGRVKKWLKDPEYSDDGKTVARIPYETTKKYTEKVMKTYHRYIKLYDLTEAQQ